MLTLALIINQAYAFQTISMTYPKFHFFGFQNSALCTEWPKIYAKNMQKHDQISWFQLLAKKENYLGDTNREKKYGLLKQTFKKSTFLYE